MSSELVPWSKSGGLGDAAGALSRALARAGHRVVAVTPRYRGIEPEEAGCTPDPVRLQVPLAGGNFDTVLWRGARDGVELVFVDHPVFRDRAGLYGDSAGSFGDNHLRFALMCRAALDAPRRATLPGGPFPEEAVFHCHDWQAALAPVYLEALYRPLGLWERAASVLTLHNPAHQGRLPSALFYDLELPSRWILPSGLEFHGDLGLLKGGILHADQLTTVSPTFAYELTSAGGGFGLESILRHRSLDLTGVLNGIDTVDWDPAADDRIAAHYSATDLAGKAACKAALQAELGLPVDPGAPLVAIVSRLDPQKGIDLVLDSIPWLVDHGAQVITLGTAAAAHGAYERSFREAESARRHAVRSWIGFDEAVAHRFFAGADLFLMPSQFEPCGLAQMQALRYGTIPIVRKTGGLADSVEPVDVRAGVGTGFLFDRPTGHAFREAIWQALELWRNNPAAWAELMVRGMTRDWSWARAIPAYQAVYRQALARRAPPAPAAE